MATLLQDIAEHVRRDGPVIRVTVIDAQGSTPREEGVWMMVSEKEIAGTIGGGALEYDAIAHAKALLEKPASQSWQRDVKDYPLGPRLGQCCGGHMRLLFERYGAEEVAYLAAKIDPETSYFLRPVSSGTPPLGIVGADDVSSAPEFVRACLTALIESNKREFTCAIFKIAENEWFMEPAATKLLPIYLYGAGHVGREVVRIFEGMAVEIVWIDTDESRFPERLPDHVRRLVIAAPQDAVAYAPDDAFHIVMSYSHPIDLEICHAVLKRGCFRYLGLIGSKTKRNRFLKRLQELGVEEADLARLVCPIGAGGPASKEPAVIAISLAAEILRLAGAPRTD